MSPFFYTSFEFEAVGPFVVEVSLGVIQHMTDRYLSNLPVSVFLTNLSDILKIKLYSSGNYTWTSVQDVQGSNPGKASNIVDFVIAN